ncbi:hypothetical protein D3C84_1058670 [compost metagenome]
MGVLHQAHERQVVQRLDQMHIEQLAQLFGHRAQDVGIEMHRVDDLDIRPLGQVTQGLADVQEAFAEVLPAVAGHQQQLASGLQERELLVQFATQPGIVIDAPGR